MDRCPVTGLQVFTEPDWTDIKLDTNSDISVRMIGHHILMVKSRGRFNLASMNRAITIERSALAAHKPTGDPFVHIEDWSEITGSSREANRFYFEMVKGEPERLGLIFLKPPRLHKRLISMAHRLRIAPTMVHLTETYEESITKATEILDAHGLIQEGRRQQTDKNRDQLVFFNDSNDAVPGNLATADSERRFKSKHVTCALEIVNSNIVSAYMEGNPRPADTVQFGSLHEKVANSEQISGPGWYFVLGLSLSGNTGRRARKAFIKELFRSATMSSYEMIVLYGAPAKLQADIILSYADSTPKVRFADDYTEALDNVECHYAPARRPQTLSDDNSIRPNGRGDLQVYVAEIVEYLEGIDWRRGRQDTVAAKDPSHPFRAVYETLDVVKWELEDIFRRRNQDEQELILARDASEAASRAKSEFLANMSHELRTPLNHIIGFTALVTSGDLGKLTAPQEEYLNDALSSSGHLLELISDILELSQAEAGKLELHITEVDVLTMLKNTMESFREQAAKQEIALTLTAPGVPATVRTDKVKLRQIVYNIVSNAVKFTPPGKSIWITAGPAQETPGALEIKVSDSGVGIAPENIERIFESFEKPTHVTNWKFEGVGLGLSLSRMLAQALGGKITAYSDGPQRGSAFTLTIPLA